MVYILYVPVIDRFNQGAQLTRAAGGATGSSLLIPGLAITFMHAFVDEIILTAFLIFGIFAITEKYNEMAPQANSGALMISIAGRFDQRIDGLSGGLGAQPCA